MNYRKEIKKLWNGLNLAIESAYKASVSTSGEPLTLRDYVENGRDLRRLLAEETANERAHRSFALGDSVPRPAISAEAAAMALIIHQTARGSEAAEMPPATNFLIWRRSAAESHLLGFLIRGHVTEEWRARALALDYVKVIHSK